jgi:hypothetical protein
MFGRTSVSEDADRKSFNIADWARTGNEDYVIFLDLKLSPFHAKEVRTPPNA